ncbi:hypothetical protein RRG08_042421 [Elysia crispata]|uniref:Uncharacterized protein n=1 Tax=Elysia crispata TaxID=231223 RepID=A0AAE0ZC21_9GAST|nr:hypothetical protein RRG08_042421 [Elysia crispata]
MACSVSLTNLEIPTAIPQHGLFSHLDESGDPYSRYTNMACSVTLTNQEIPTADAPTTFACSISLTN